MEETFTTAENLVADYPQLATWTDVGDSWEKTQNGLEGYDLFVLKLTNSQVGGDKPKLFATSAIHAREYATAELTTRFAEYLLDHYQSDPNVTWLLDHHEIHLMLHTNPDGRKQAETGLSWRKNTNNDFCSNTNSRGIDLNRNFLFQWGCCGGSSGDPCQATFRGPAPASEPETQAVQAYMEGIFPDQRPDDLTTPAPADATGIYFDIHSFGEIILSSWGFTSTPPPNEDGIMTLSRKLGFYNGYEPHLGSLGTVDGATKDFAYGTLGLPAYTIELGTTFFQDCTFFEQNLLPQNLQALLQAAKWTRTPYITPSGPEFAQITLDQVVLEPGDTLQAQSLVDDDRYNHVGGTEPTQNIQAAEAYVDIPPWSPGATPHAMTATDGVFDQVSESVQVNIDTTGLPDGKHSLFFRGQDADGNWGAVNGAFFYVLDPVTAPRIEGTVVDAATGAPLDAVVSTGPITTGTDPVTGFYQLLVPPGTHTVSATADGHAGDQVADVTVAAGQTFVLDFSLTPICAALEDDMESGPQGWAPQGPWSQTTALAHSPTHSWTDSPGGNYSPNVNWSLTSQTLDFTGMDHVSLTFWHRYDTESGFDFGSVEYSADNGSSWTSVVSFSGLLANWEQVHIDIAQLDGVAEAKIRFRFSSDSSQQRDGWYIDDVSLSGASIVRCAPLTLPQMIELWPDIFTVADMILFINQN